MFDLALYKNQVQLIVLFSEPGAAEQGVSQILNYWFYLLTEKWIKDIHHICILYLSVA
ncbi:hypothetical protein HMPREF0208_00503 [Citrobacter koseri]|nr:hypothetical protein HMPREF3220_01315 [Citrobacter koseri]KXA05463.1 hypothetical protein HMPREF3207_00812 [Citrobacter koseri]KXB46886.1 hypothetical protein HMPREF0208_00503 [Citrobacter koseri]